MLTKESITEALKAVKYPGYSRDIVSFGLIKNIALHEGEVVVSVQMTTPNADSAAQIKRDAEGILKKLPGIVMARVDVLAAAGQPAGSPGAAQQKIPGTKRVVAVASGKGGV